MAKMKTKSVSFNIECPEERQQFEYSNSMPNFSRYVKTLIDRDMQKKKPEAQSSGGIRIRLD